MKQFAQREHRKACFRSCKPATSSTAISITIHTSGSSMSSSPKTRSQSRQFPQSLGGLFLSEGSKHERSRGEPRTRLQTQKIRRAFRHGGGRDRDLHGGPKR